MKRKFLNNHNLGFTPHHQKATNANPNTPKPRPAPKSFDPRVWLKNRGAGFTLPEIIVALTIFSLASLALFNFIVQGYKTQRYHQEQQTALDNARRGISTMIKEIREAKYADNGNYPIELADDQEFIFYSNIDQDAKTERVRYFLDGNEFKKGVIKPTDFPIEYLLTSEVVTTLSSYVRNGTETVFRYYDGQNNLLDSPARLSQTKLMHLYLKIDVNPNTIPSPFELESETQLRNLKDNL